MFRYLSIRILTIKFRCDRTGKVNYAMNGHNPCNRANGVWRSH
ncbi:MAG: hypothetical protein ACYT04_24615 [Nostoc sp.]